MNIEATNSIAPITHLLPKGGIGRIAEELEVPRQIVSYILSGTKESEYSDQRKERVLKRAAEIMLENSTKQKEAAEIINNSLSVDEDKSTPLAE
jgi:hypothetical protein